MPLKLNKLLAFASRVKKIQLQKDNRESLVSSLYDKCPCTSRSGFFKMGKT